MELNIQHTVLFHIITSISMCYCLKSKIYMKKELKFCPHNEDTDIRRGQTTTLETCHRKLEIYLKFDNINKTYTKKQFLMVDTVYDTNTKEVVKLLRPLIVSIRQEPVSLAYPIQHLYNVNSKPYETVYHYENTANFSGCHSIDDAEKFCNPTREERNMYRMGYCCNCDENCSTYHTRGGQTCQNATDNITDTTSAHCFRYHPIWYSVNEIHKKEVLHGVHIQVYHQHRKKSETESPRPWASIDDDLGTDLRVGTDTPVSNSDNLQIRVSYREHMQLKHILYPQPLTYTKHRLLIPNSVYEGSFDEVPKPLKKGPPTYLVVPSNHISIEGSECDKIGVSNVAFMTQDDKCARPAQSCFARQPLDLWLHDEDYSLRGKTGKFWVQSHGDLSDTPLLYNKMTKKKMILFQHTHRHVSDVVVEINADSLVVLHRGAHALIDKVTSVSDITQLTIHLQVTNTGVVASQFTAVATCPEPYFTSTSPTKLVSPQHTVMFSLKFDNIMVNDTEKSMCCEVHVLNHKMLVIASRKVIVKIADRCFCVAHCECKCFKDDDFSCESLNTTELTEAGFRDTLPEIHTVIPGTQIQIVRASLLLVAALLALGFVKGWIGLFIPCIGNLGLCFFNDSALKEYYESYLKGMDVVHDDRGKPIHPNKNTRVRLIGKKKEFFLNIIICFYLPFIWIHWIVDYCYGPGPYMPVQDQDPDSDKYQRSQYLNELSDDEYEKPYQQQKSPRDYEPLKNGGPRMDLYESTPEGTCKSPVISPCVTRLGLSLKTPTPSSSEGSVDYEDYIKSPVSKETDALQLYRKRKKAILKRSPEASLRKSPRLKKVSFSTEASLTQNKILHLLDQEEVYCNFKESNSHLLNSGNRFSLAGNLSKVGEADIYKFTIGYNRTQVYEFAHGEFRSLTTVLPIKAKFFQQVLNPDDVLLHVTAKPIYKCLNKVL